MPHNTAGYFYPSYIDPYSIDGKTNFEQLADTLPRIGPIVHKTVNEGDISVSADSIDILYMLTGAGRVLLPTDAGADFPVGAQAAFVNLTKEEIVIEPSHGVTLINGDDSFVIPPQKVGNLVKLNANFWLLSLGTGSGGSQPDGVPDAPAIAFAPDRLSMNWKTPDSPTPILNYAANVTPEGCKWHIDGTTLVVDAPVGGVEHTFEVYAVNARGNSAMSNLLVTAYTVPGVPTIKSLTAGPGAFTAAWELLEGAAHFIVQYRRVGDTDWAEKQFESPNVSGQVAGLLGETDYEVRLLAANIAGRGEPSASQSVRTNAAYTDKPQIAHTGYGQYTITNYNASWLYTIHPAAGTGAVSGNVITMDAVNTAFRLDSQVNALGPAMSVSGERRRYTTHSENHPYKCGTHECNCREDWGGCHCGTGAPCDAQSWGQCGCPGDMCWYNRTRTCDQCDTMCDNWVEVKDGTPPGFEDSFGEWSRVDAQAGAEGTAPAPYVAPLTFGVHVVEAHGEAPSVYGWFPVDYDEKNNVPVPGGAKIATVTFMNGDRVVGYYGSTFDAEDLRLSWFKDQHSWGYLLKVEQPEWLGRGARWKFDVLSTDMKLELSKEGVVA